MGSIDWMDGCLDIGVVFVWEKARSYWDNKRKIEDE